MSLAKSNAFSPIMQPANSSNKLNQLLSQNQNIIQHTIHELEPMSRYSLRILALNAIGKSRASVALSVRTDEEGECRGLIMVLHSINCVTIA